jgi:hypothetical protein
MDEPDPPPCNGADNLKRARSVVIPQSREMIAGRGAMKTGTFRPWEKEIW